MSLCVNCGKKGTLKCSGCSRDNVMYCGKACQIADWKRHKPVCKKNPFYERWSIIQRGERAFDGRDEEVFRTVFQNIFKTLDPDQYKKKFMKIMKLSIFPEDTRLFLFSDVVTGFMCLESLKMIGSSLDDKDKKWLSVLQKLKESCSAFLTEDDFRPIDIQEKWAKSKECLFNNSTFGHMALSSHFLDLIRTDVCEVCGIPTQSKCAGCEKVYYCGRKCNQQAWPSHKKVCDRIDRK